MQNHKKDKQMAIPVIPNRDIAVLNIQEELSVKKIPVVYREQCNC